MVPLTEGRVKRFLVEGKRHHPPTPLYSSSSQSHDQEEVDPVDNFELEPIEYCNQLPPIHGRKKKKRKAKRGGKGKGMEHRRNSSKQKECSSFSVISSPTLAGRRRRSKVLQVGWF
ncbi:hypothetical protein Tco_1115783 [Tanacetum coccineum]